MSRRSKSPPVTVEPCGCIRDESQWTKLCKIHQDEYDVTYASCELGALLQLMQYYDRNPSDDNLRCVVSRIVAVGPAVNQSAEVVEWITANKLKLLNWKRAHANPTGK